MGKTHSNVIKRKECQCIALTYLFLSTLRVSICAPPRIASGGPRGIRTRYGVGALQHIIWGCITRDVVVSTLDTSEIWRFGA
jgi:hypothetical protein